MKLSLLLTQRQALLRQVRLANLAFAYAKLSEFAVRISRARLHGPARLQQADGEPEPRCAALTTIDGRQSLIEEHFTDEDIADFADAIAFITGESQLDLILQLEELADRFVAPLREHLEQAGVAFDPARQAIGEPKSGNPAA